MNIINFIMNFVFITNFTSGFKLTYCDPENMIHFSFFMIVFPTYPVNHNTKDFCFLNQGTKTKLFLAAKVKMITIWFISHFLSKQLCCCCLNTWFFSRILIGVRFCNSFQLYVFFFLCINILRLFYNYWTLSWICVLLKKYIVASHLI